MKRAFRWLAALLALLIPAAACAELALTPVFQYMSSITSVAGSGYVILTDRDSGLRGVYTTDGQEVMPCTHANLTSAANDFFTELKDKENVNSRAIFTLDNRQISDFAYGQVKSYNRHWIAGYVLSEGAEDSYDVKLSGAFYRIERCDLFYVDDAEKDSYLVGSIGDQAFLKADVHGAFISVQRKDESITVYDRDFNALDLEVAGVTKDIYAIQDYSVLEPGTGRAIINEYVSVQEADTPDGLLLLATRYDWKGQRYTDIYDDQGNLFHHADVELYSTDGRYGVTVKSKKYGLYDLAERKELVPALYNKIVTGNTATNSYVFDGYVMVELDGLRGYVDTRTGEVSCEIKYDPTGLKRAGCAFYYIQDDGILLVAADGVESHPAVDSLTGVRGSGALLAAKKGDFYGVIDWHGQEQLPFMHNKGITLTDDGFGLIRTSTGVELDQILR